jgi:hypothetical protein
MSEVTTNQPKIATCIEWVPIRIAPRNKIGERYVRLLYCDDDSGDLYVGEYDIERGTHATYGVDYPSGITHWALPPVGPSMQWTLDLVHGKNEEAKEVLKNQKKPQ